METEEFISGFAEPVTAVRQCAVNMKKKMGKGYLPLWTVPIKDV